MMVDAFIFMSLVVFGNAFLLIPNAPRSVVKILAVGNGGPWGSWYQPQYCPNGSYAVGYNMKIQDDQRDHDDTGLNAISLRCQPLNMSRDVGDITSEEGGWGTWVGLTMCENYYSYYERTFLTSFALQVEPNKSQPKMIDVFIILSLAVLGDTLFLIPNAPRSAGKILAVGNGGRWGSWYQPQYCPEGSYAVGYNMKIQGEQHDNDDTGLNAISLRCQPLGVSRDVGDITSEEGGWGTWVGWTMCNIGPEYQRTFLTSFSLQVEVNQFSGDDTAANFVKFMCRSFNSSSQERELSYSPGHGPWGSYGDWSQSCPLNSAICGIQTKVEPFQGDSGLFGGDDTALNDVQFICCNDTSINS